MKKLHFIISFLFGVWLYAQEERKIIDGVIHFDYVGIEYDDIIITNLNTGMASSTNILGQFSISAKEGDILEAKGVNIFTNEITIQDYHLNEGYIFILLEPLVIPMQDMKVSSFKFSGNLEMDAKRVKIKDSLNDALTKMGVPLGRERDEWAHINAPIWTPAIPNVLSIDAISDAITGEKKRRIALYNFNKKKNIVDKVRDYYKDEFFINQLQVPANEIDTFILTLLEVENVETYFNEGDYYTIMEIMKDFSSTYKKRLLIGDSK